MRPFHAVGSRTSKWSEGGSMPFTSQYSGNALVAAARVEPVSVAPSCLMPRAYRGSGLHAGEVRGKCRPRTVA
ncbi:hypothetical protein ACN28E_15875 [Archangium lansingense]|uniref:hypothetical protein n=1 Tax=Archangium lansingense TaxID=2995310 RepID=UPI003B80438A